MLSFKLRFKKVTVNLKKWQTSLIVCHLDNVGAKRIVLLKRSTIQICDLVQFIRKLNC